MNSLQYFKLHPDVKDPAYGTKASSCFDICAFLQKDVPVRVYTFDGHLEERPVLVEPTGELYVFLNHNERSLIPTGLIFDIPPGFTMRAYPRSGLSVKEGLILANCVGVIDEDYVDPFHITLFNVSGTVAKVKNGERLCQAELKPDLRSELSETSVRPAQKTDRAGGFGSTGKS